METEELTGILKRLEKEETERFSCVVSNPPYHLDVGKSHQVYPDFYLTARQLSRFVSMVFPLGWQRSTGKASGSALHPLMRQDKSIVRVDNYYETQDSPLLIFPNVGTGGVNLLFRDSEVADERVSLCEYGAYVEDRDLATIKYWSDESGVIFEKLTSWVTSKHTGWMKEKITGRNPFGINGFLTTDQSRSGFALVSQAPTPDSVKFWGRELNSSKYRWFYLPRSYSGLKLKNEDKWKAVWPKSGAYANHRRVMKFASGELFTDTFICAYFDSEEEVDGFITYFKTLFYRFLISERATDHNAHRTVHEYVPDLSTVKNPRTGRTGWQSDWTDDDLKSLLKDVLTEEDWSYIEKVAIESDPAGLRKLSREQADISI